MNKSSKTLKKLICIITALAIIFMAIFNNSSWADEDNSQENLGDETTAGEENIESDNEANIASATERIYNPRQETSVCRIAVHDENGDIIDYDYYDSLEEASTSMDFFARRIELVAENIEISSTVEFTGSTDYELVTAQELIEQGKTTTITRAPGFTGTMISNTNPIILSNVTIDGGWGNSHTGIEATGPIINGQSTINLNNVKLKNNYNTSSDGGGAICCSSSITANSGTIIENCASTYAGAIKAIALIANDLTVNKCYSTNVSGNAASAIYIGSGWPGLQAYNMQVTNCVAVNAETGGAAIYTVAGVNTSFGTQDNPNCNVNISNNYSHGTYSGFFQESGWTPVSIYDDIVINGNKAGCTIDSDWNVTATGKNSNLNISNIWPVNFYTDITSESNVGVTVIDGTASDGKINFAALNGHTGIANGYYADSDTTPAFDNNGYAAIGENDELPPDTSEVTIKIVQNENNGKSHTYKVVKDWETDVVATTTQSGTTSSSNCITFIAEADHYYRIILDDGWSNEYSDVEISGEMAQGVGDPVKENGSVFFVNVYVNSDATANTTSIITYNFISETPPDTGVKGEVAKIIFFVGLIVIYGIILIKIKE